MMEFLEYRVSQVLESILSTREMSMVVDGLDCKVPSAHITNMEK